MIFKILGALGLILITIGTLIKNRKEEHVLFLLGGLSLLVYSISIRDPIFIPLQIIFTIASAYYLIKKN